MKVSKDTIKVEKDPSKLLDIIDWLQREMHKDLCNMKAHPNAEYAPVWRQRAMDNSTLQRVAINQLVSRQRSWIRELEKKVKASRAKLKSETAVPELDMEKVKQAAGFRASPPPPAHPLEYRPFKHPKGVVPAPVDPRREVRQASARGCKGFDHPHIQQGHC